MLIMVSVVGYYGLLHTSLPLKVFEAAIEEDGNVDIQGLDGNLASGFSADTIRFKSVDDQWSSLSDIKFKYEGDRSFFGTEKLVIKDLSVGSGTIYADWDPEENELDFDSDFGEELREIDDEFDELGDELQKELGTSPAIRKLQIERMSVANLKIINPTTELEIAIDELRFEGFNWQYGDLQNLGQLSIRSSQMDLETVPSVEFAARKNARRYVGTIRTQADHRLRVDVPFVFDFAVDDDLNVSVKSELFEGQVQIHEEENQSTIHFLDFTPDDFFELKSGVVLPSNIAMKLEFDNDEMGPVQVNNDGSFNYGKTRFDDLRIEQIEGERSVVKASGDVNGNSVTATIGCARPYSSQWSLNLECPTTESPEDLWAQTLFGSDFSGLDLARKRIVRSSIPDSPTTETDPANPTAEATGEETTADQSTADEVTAEEPVDEQPDARPTTEEIEK